MSENKPNYYAIIPANVRYCKDIEMGARFLYGEITSLTQKEGYCWASNSYFAELYDVDISTIKRWISSLLEKKFIHVEIDQPSGNKRKIWIINVVKNISTSAQKRADPQLKNEPTPRLKNEPHNIKEVNTKEEYKEKKDKKEKSAAPPSSPSAPPPPNFFIFDQIRIEEEKYIQLKKRFSDVDVDREIERANNWLLANGKKKKNYHAFMSNWLDDVKNRKNYQKQPEKKFAPCSTGESLNTELYESWKNGKIS